MTEEVRTIVDLIEARKDSLSVEHGLAYKKFRMWQALLEKVIGIDPLNPNIVALTLTQKIIAYTGVIESLNLGNGSANSFTSYFDCFSENERFLLMMSIRLGKDMDSRKVREEEIVDAYLRKSTDEFNGLFAKTLNNDDREIPGIYNLRSRMVHSGEYTVAMVFSTGENRTYSPDMKIEIDEKLVSLDELFLIGFCKHAGIEVSLNISRVKHFLLHNYYATKSQEYHQLFSNKFSNS